MKRLFAQRNAGARVIILNDPLCGVHNLRHLKKVGSAGGGAIHHASGYLLRAKRFNDCEAKRRVTRSIYIKHALCSFGHSSDTRQD